MVATENVVLLGTHQVLRSSGPSRWWGGSTQMDKSEEFKSSAKDSALGEGLLAEKLPESLHRESKTLDSRCYEPPEGCDGRAV